MRVQDQNAFPRLRENESDEMSLVVMFARELAAIGQAAVLLLHHMPKDSSTPRGPGVLHGDADTTMTVEGKGAKRRTIRLLKNRNGASDGTITFGIGIETVGRDEDGDAITAAIATEDAGTEVGTIALTRTESELRRLLVDLTTSEGQQLPLEFQDGSKGIAEKRWRDEFDNERLSTSSRKDSRDRAFRRAYKNLRIHGIVGARQGWVWLTD